MVKVKTQKNSGKTFTYRWSSHKPVIYTALELIKPEFILELGMGHFSSPIFLNSSAKKTIHIDNIPEWIEMVKEKNLDIIDNNKSEFIHQDLNGITLAQRYYSLSQQQKDDINNYYKELSSKVKTMNYNGKLMFTDGFTALRRASIDILTNDFDMAIYHDAEDTETYDYQNISKKLSDKNDHYVLKTKTTWTGFFLKKDSYDKSKLKDIMNQSVERYIKEINETKDGIELINV